MHRADSVFASPSSAHAQQDIASAWMEWEALDVEEGIAADLREYARAARLSALKTQALRRVVASLGQ